MSNRKKYVYLLWEMNLFQQYSYSDNKKVFGIYDDIKKAEKVIMGHCFLQDGGSKIQKFEINKSYGV